MTTDTAELSAAVPKAVIIVCRELRAAGYEAYAVGGAVRDALLGAEVGDWDVATSAPPARVQALFRHTIPTGIEHGTVTVVIGKGRARHAIEVTTFRGEGAYTDARRPDEVVFGVSLEEDLARRDFVVNAIAYDPLADELRDPFGGRGDLERRTIRAVGDPNERFSEDGLRIMRALRFVAQLDFELEPATEAAMPGALASLAKVARERVHAELKKLLVGRAAARALAIEGRHGVLSVAIPELGRWLATLAPGARDKALCRAAAAPRDPDLRLAALIAPAPGQGVAEIAPAAGRGGLEALEDRRAAERAEAVMRGLKSSNAERKRVCQLVSFFGAAQAEALGAPLARRIAGAVGRARAGDLAALWLADADADRDANSAAAARSRDAARELGEVLARGDPVSPRDLAISGGEVMQALGLSPGPAVGDILAALVEAVCDDPALNTREALLALARERAPA